jgi:hypothetical protein
MSEGMRRRKAGGDDDSGVREKRKPAVTLASLDMFPHNKLQAEDQVKTSTGASVSLASLLVIALLLLSELRSWLTVRRSEHMTVDAVVEGRVRINFDITLHALPCDQVNLDAMDVAGEQQNGVDHDFLKVRLDLDGRPKDAAPIAGAIEPRALGEAGAGGALAPASPAPLPADYCGPCYGAREGCCNSCDEVRGAYVAKGWDAGDMSRNSEQCVREGRTAEGGQHKLAMGPAAGSTEGCRLSGHLQVNKVAGNFHIAMGETHQRGAGHIHQFNPSAIANYNVTHTIHALSFGEAFPGQHNPLDGVAKAPEEGSAVYMYYVKVIPTQYQTGAAPAAAAGARGGALSTYQYSVSSQMRPAVVKGVRQNVLPGLFFVYEMAPYLVTVTEARGSFLHFLTGLCAILGGVITLARLADTLLHTGSSVLKWGGGEEEVARAVKSMSSATKAALAQAAAAVSPAEGRVSGGLSMNSDLLGPTPARATEKNA